MTLMNGSNGHASMNGGAYPLDPLSPSEISTAVEVVRKAKPARLLFSVVTLAEPAKAEMLAWLQNTSNPKPDRLAEILVIDKSTKEIYEGIVSLSKLAVTKWTSVKNVQPILGIEELAAAEEIVRNDPKVIEQCEISGVPAGDMHKIFCDAWTIGFEKRFGVESRMQQALMYYRDDLDDNQYSCPLDFCPVIDVHAGKVVHIDIPSVRRPLHKVKPSNYFPKDIKNDESGYRQDLKPIHITQPDGVSFSMDGNNLKWQNWSVHIGFNYREGIVLSNISYNDHGTIRPIFYRLSLAEMVVPYGHPQHPHHRKHAFDLGEYGAGAMTNSLKLGCACKGAIHYLDFTHVNEAGQPKTVENAVCIHEEDSGVLFTHTDFRDRSTITTRGRNLIISHLFTPANYEYCVYWILSQDGSVGLDIKLTGILSTYAMNTGEDLQSYGTCVHPGVNAHNHQHIFCLRADCMIDGVNNTVVQTDACQGAAEVGSAENPHGNAFYAKKTPLKTTAEGIADYDASTTRSWEICNPNKLHPSSGKPVAYKLLSKEIIPLLPKENSLVWKRGAFTRHAIHVTPYAEDQLYPAGTHVAQTSGEPSKGITEWIGDGKGNIDNTDIVLWHTFGLTHFPAPEDFPIMNAELVKLSFVPRNFFLRNPALDVPPSHVQTPKEVASGRENTNGLRDEVSRFAFS